MCLVSSLSHMGIISFARNGTLRLKKKVSFLVHVRITHLPPHQVLFLSCSWRNHFCDQSDSVFRLWDVATLAAADSVLCILFLLSFVVYYGNIIKSQKCLSTTVVC